MQSTSSNNISESKPKLSSSKTIPKFWKLFSFNNSTTRSSNHSSNNNEGNTNNNNNNNSDQHTNLNLAGGTKKGRNSSATPDYQDQFRRRLYKNKRATNHSSSSKRLSAFFLTPNDKQHEENKLLKRQSCAVVMSHHHHRDTTTITTADDDDLVLTADEQPNSDTVSLPPQLQQEDHYHHPSHVPHPPIPPVPPLPPSAAASSSLTASDDKQKDTDSSPKDEGSWHIVNTPSSTTKGRPIESSSAASSAFSSSSSSSSPSSTSSHSTCNHSVKGSPSSSASASPSTATSEAAAVEHKNEANLLREELEREKKVVAALQKQKEASAKDLDYFGRIVEKLADEKSVLSQRLELEKLNVKHKEQDMSILLEKIKTSADDARYKSLEASKYKRELDDLRSQVERDNHAYEDRIRHKDEKINHLHSQLGKAEEQIQALKYAMEQLAKAQTNAVATPASGHASSDAEKKIEPRPAASRKCSSTFTEHSSSSSSISSGARDGGAVPGNPQTPTAAEKPSSAKGENDTLDRELRDLTQEKEQLLLQYSKIPISGATRQSRRQKDQLEERLDKVDAQLSRVKQKIRIRRA